MAKRHGLPVGNKSIGRNPLSSFPAPAHNSRTGTGNTSGNVPVPNPQPIPAKGSPKAGQSRSPRRIK